MKKIVELVDSLDNKYLKILGRLVYLYLRFFKNKCFIVCGYGIGDTIMACMLARRYMEKIKCKEVILILKESHNDLAKLFDDIDGRIVSGRLVKCLKSFSEQDNVYINKNYVFAHFQLDANMQLTREYYDSMQITVLEKYRELVFELPDNINYSFPKLRNNLLKNNDVLNRIQLKPNERVIVLCPYASSARLISDTMWIELANILKNSGYRVFTNLSDIKEKPIYNTEILNLKLVEFAMFCNLYVNYVVSLRSGICDLLAFNKCGLIVLYTDKLYFDEWRIIMLNSKRKKCTELLLSSNNHDEVKTKIIEEITK